MFILLISHSHYSVLAYPLCSPYAVVRQWWIIFLLYRDKAVKLYSFIICVEQQGPVLHTRPREIPLLVRHSIRCTVSSLDSCISEKETDNVNKVYHNSIYNATHNGKTCLILFYLILPFLHRNHTKISPYLDLVYTQGSTEIKYCLIFVSIWFKEDICVPQKCFWFGLPESLFIILWCFRCKFVLFLFCM